MYPQPVPFPSPTRWETATHIAISAVIISLTHLSSDYSEGLKKSSSRLSLDISHRMALGFVYYTSKEVRSGE